MSGTPTHNRIPHHKSQWSWNRVIQGMFPREFVDKVMWPYIKIFRPTMVATRHVPVSRVCKC